MKKITDEFIDRIPKTDLHVHLDGSIRLSTLLELARAKGVALPADDEAGLKRLVFKKRFSNLKEYLRCFSYCTAVLQDASSLERASYELAKDNIQEGVRYIEVRFAPQLHQNEQMTTLSVLEAVNKGLRKARNEFNAEEKIRSKIEPAFEYGLIVCALRMFDHDYSRYFDMLLDIHRHSERKWIYFLASQELVKAAVEAKIRHKIPVVGFDLAGLEKGYPAAYFKDAYDLAHKHFLNKTVHAGEDYGPESIFQAITDLNADRIGHGVHLFDSTMIQDEEIEDREAYIENLVKYIADHRITVEVCLTSNLQTIPDMKRLENHSFGKMRKAKLSVTLCTDNRTVSSTTVTEEIRKAVKAFRLTPKELKNFVIYGFKRSFFPGTYLKKRKYIRQIIDYYEDLEKEYA